MSDKNCGYHQCQNCHYAFSDARQLEHHLKVYDEELEDIAINAAKALRHYPITHEILCPYINQKCRNSRFARFQDFASHYNTHLECKKECPGCGTRFTRSSQLMAHGCKAANEDPAKKKKLVELKDWAIERNLYEAKQAQLKFREELSKEGKAFLSTSHALRLMIRALIPKANTDVTTKIRDEVAKHMDFLIDSLIEKTRQNLDEVSLHDRGDAKVVQHLTLDHYYDTNVPCVDPVRQETLLVDSGYYLLHDRIAKPEAGEENRKILPREPDHPICDAQDTTSAEPVDLALQGSTKATSTTAIRRAGRRVVRGKPRPGVKEPRPKINGPPRIRDKGKNRITKPSRRVTIQEPHLELDGYVGSTFYTKQEPLSPSDTEGTDSEDGIGDVLDMDRTDRGQFGFATESRKSLHPYMTANVHVFHANLPDPAPRGSSLSQASTAIGAGEMDASDDITDTQQDGRNNPLHTPRSISPSDAALGPRPRMLSLNVEGAVSAGHSSGIPQGQGTQSHGRGSIQGTTAPLDVPSMPDGLPYHLRRGSAPTITGPPNSHHHIDRASNMAHGSGSAFIGSINAVPVNGFMVGWNPVNYQEWPASNMLLGDPLAQSIPPGVQSHPPMVLGDSAPESFLGAATMAEAVNSSPGNRLSFDSQASYLGSSSNHSSSYDSGSRPNFISSTGRRPVDPDAWSHHAPSDEKATYNFSFD